MTEVDIWLLISGDIYEKETGFYGAVPQYARLGVRCLWRGDSC
jgi:hypothetical protein